MKTAHFCMVLLIIASLMYAGASDDGRGFLLNMLEKRHGRGRGNQGCGRGHGRGRGRGSCNEEGSGHGQPDSTDRPITNFKAK